MATLTPLPLKIAYLGGGSREWARKLTIDLALCLDLKGEIALYDIDTAIADEITPNTNQHNANQDLIVESTETENSDLDFHTSFNGPSHHLYFDLAWELFTRLLQFCDNYLPAAAVI